MTTAPAPETAKTKKKRADVFLARAAIYIPLDMANTETLALATKAVNAIEASLPAGSKVEFVSRAFGKMPG